MGNREQIIPRYGDAFLALFVLAIALLLLVPFPTAAIDVLLALNIAFALLLLLVGLYLPNSLALLAFPTILLLTTLFRLGLNIATTRLILSQGDAGQVISAFGTFLIRGELAVGIVIFAIITLVNFIVIARGAGRVSEVAARFALDALPGKQMAIDSDLRAGVITAHEAQEKRERLRQESQLYGAMDGSMKFVQGDVVAGIFITFVNILGGMYIGIRNGLSFADALDTYTILTVGDGLVTQIPALLISICAGIVVTRVSSGEGSTLSGDLRAQIFAHPGLLFMAALLAALIGLLPQLPTLPFLVVAMMLGGSGWWAQRRMVGVSGSGHNFGGGRIRPILLGAGEAVTANAAERGVLLLELDSSICYRAYGEKSGTYQDWWDRLRRDCWEYTGLELPEIEVAPDPRALPATYSVRWRDLEIDRGSLVLDSVLVEISPAGAAVFGLEATAVVAHPVSGNKIVWVRLKPGVKSMLEAVGLRSYDFVEAIMWQAGAYFCRHPEDVVNLVDVHQRLRELERNTPGLLTDLTGAGFINAARLTAVMQELARQGMNIRDFRTILETVASYCSGYGSSLVQQGEFDVDDIVGFIRLNHKRQTIKRCLNERGTFRAVTVSPEIEEMIDSATLANGGLLFSLDPRQYETMSQALTAVLEPLQSRGLPPVSILCRSELRSKVLAFLRIGSRPLEVVAFEELDPVVVVEPAGIWSL